MISINNQAIQLKTFPDRTMNIHCEIDKYDRDATYNITWKYDNEAENMQLFYLVKHLRSHGVKKINLHMPYIPNARMDRVKSDYDIFTLKYFAEFINSLEFDNVFVLDPHSNVSAALINNIKIRSPQFFLINIIDELRIAEKNDLFIFYPDEGASKRYTELIDHLHIQHAFGVKSRDWATGQLCDEIQIYGDCPDDLGNRPVLIVDDICSRGGTFVRAAAALKKRNAGNIYLYVSHCEDNIYTGKLLSENIVKCVYTTDSIFRNMADPRVVVMKSDREE